jgi:hypothetical protein
VKRAGVLAVAVLSLHFISRPKPERRPTTAPRPEKPAPTGGGAPLLRKPDAAGGGQRVTGRGDTLTDQRLTDESVALIVKRRGRPRAAVRALAARRLRQRRPP